MMIIVILDVELKDDIVDSSNALPEQPKGIKTLYRYGNVRI